MYPVKNTKNDHFFLTYLLICYSCSYQALLVLLTGYMFAVFDTC